MTASHWLVRGRVSRGSWDGWTNVVAGAAWADDVYCLTPNCATDASRGAWTEGFFWKDDDWEELKMKVLSILLMFVAVPMLAGETVTAVTVEVLAASTKEWSSSYTIPGSSGTTETSCSANDSTMNCTSQTIGRTADIHSTWNHWIVTARIKMPDGSIVLASCYLNFRWNFCAEPSAGQYQAKVGKHDIRLLIPVQKKRPEYNRDGTLKKPAEYTTREVKFNLR